MNAMYQEMQHQGHRSVRKVIVKVEQESMESVLEDGPNNVSGEEACHGLGDCRGGHQTRKLQWSQGSFGESRECNGYRELNQ